MKRSCSGPIQFLVCVLILGFMTGCGDTIKTIEADNNAYQCSACQNKFYTGKDIFAACCPKCKSYELKEIVSYACAQNHSTLAPRGSSVACSACGAPASRVQFPSEQASKEWGGQKASKAEVSKK